MIQGFLNGNLLFWLGYNVVMSNLTKLMIKDDNLNFIKTNKYKSVNLYIRYCFDYSSKLKTNLYILSSMLTETSEKYKTKLEMAKARDMLYGIECYCNQTNLENLLVFQTHFEFINPKFLKGLSEKDFADYIDEVMSHPYFTEELLQEAKRLMKDNLLRNLDNPSYLASNNFYDEISKDDAKYEIYSKTDVVDLIDGVTLEDLNETYNQLKDASKIVFLIGDYSEDLLNYVKTYRNSDIKHTNLSATVLNKREDVTFNKDVSQSTLIMSYTSDISRNSNDYYAFNLGNILFGGIPSSLLFSEVREKHSLCYTISARANRNEGLLQVKTLIEKDKKDETVNEIRKQFKRIIDKDYDEELINVCKIMLANNTRGIDDDLDYLVDYNFNSIVNGLYQTTEEYLEEINKVIADDISRVYKRLNEYMVYFLQGDKHE